MRLRHARLLALALASAALCSGGTRAAGIGFGGESYAKVQKPVSFAPAADHRGEAESLLWINKPGTVKGVRKVVVPFFQIQFVTRSHADATQVQVNASSTMIMRLVDPTPEQMQAIADATYQRLVADLTAAGFEVVAPEAAAGFPSWREMQADMKPSGTSVDGMNGVTSTFVSPAGRGWYLLPTSDPALSGGGRFTTMGNIGMVRREQALLAESGAAVLGFRAVVDFASVKSSDQGMFGHHGLTAWTQGKAGLAVRPVATQLFLIAPDAKGTMMDPQSRYRIELSAPLMIDSGAITAIQDSASAGQKIGAGLASAMSILGGGGGHGLKQFDVRVDPAVWQTDVTGALGGVADMMVARLAAER